MLSKIHFCTDLGGYFIFLVLAVKVKSLPQEKKKNKKKKTRDKFISHAVWEGSS